MTGTPLEFVFVFTVGLVNLGAGFALAVYLGRGPIGWHFLRFERRPLRWKRNDSHPSLDEE